MLLLEVLDGQFRRALVLEGPRIRIGRDPDCEIYLPGDPTVSRVHAVLADAGTHWTVTDPGSRNGTMLNGAPVQGTLGLRIGDLVQVGRYGLRLAAGGQVELAETLPAESAAGVRPLPGLSLRESEIVGLVAEGMTDQQIAERLFLSVKTVHSHLDRIRSKTGLRRRPDLTRWVMEQRMA